MPPTRNPALITWINSQIQLCQPDQVHWCDGSEAERAALTEQAVAQGILV
jgi:phosphoenolpyruvate carboxykinase (GTP)